MTRTAHLDGRITVHAGDCADVLKTLPDNSVDACVTDPPYALTEVKPMGVQGFNYQAKNGRNSEQKAARRGFMNKAWDTGERAFSVDLWAEVLRVLKPGGHLLSMGGTRTYHRMVCAIEDAGFEVRDCVLWAYGSGFPKSVDVSRAIDKAAGAEREVIGPGQFEGRRPRPAPVGGTGGLYRWGDEHLAWDALPENARDYFEQAAPASTAITAPATEAARQWEGWGSALKPAVEPIVLARKPLSESSIAANVLKWGVGALNIGKCRVGTTKDVPASGTKADSAIYGVGSSIRRGDEDGFNPNIGRWPANLILEKGSPEVLAAFPETASGIKVGGKYSRETGVHEGGQRHDGVSCFGDSGSAARFFQQCPWTEEDRDLAERENSASRLFYSSKAADDDRLGSAHPTVKPLDLMQYLVRLICRRGGLVLDPFAGTGTTAEAAIREGCKAVLIEREPEYLADIERRCSLILAGPDARLHATIKAKNRPEEPLPLFGGLPPQ